MHTPLLEELGLSPNEAKIYEALITFGGSGVSTISLRSKVHRRNAYDSLHRLIEKGLVYEIFGQGETVYEAVEPGKLMELIREKELKLGQALPEMSKVFASHRTPQRAFIFRGLEGIKNMMRKMLQTGEDVYILGAEGAWFDPRIATYSQWFIKEAKKKGMKLHILFDWEIQEKRPDLIAGISHPHKFLPEDYDTNSTMDIFGDYVVTYTGVSPGQIDDDVSVFVMKSATLAESYRTWWRYLWDSLPNPSTKRKR